MVLRFAAAVSTLILLCPVTAGTTILAQRNLDERVAKADLIIIGEVGQKRSHMVGRRMMTDTAVAIERVLMGQAAQVVTITQLGGTIDGRTVDVVGDAVLRPGQRVLLLTYRHPDGNRYLVGMAQGAILLEPASPGASDIDRGIQAVDVAVLNDDGRVERPMESRTVYVEEIVRAIARKNVNRKP